MTDSASKYLYFATIVPFCSLYAAQPIRPLFKSEFQLSNFQAILFTTLMMAPLGVAPLVYGYLLESFSAKVMLRWALFALGILELLFAIADSYFTLAAGILIFALGTLFRRNPWLGFAGCCLSALRPAGISGATLSDDCLCLLFYPAAKRCGGEGWLESKRI